MLTSILTWLLPVAYAAADPDVASTTNAFTLAYRDNIFSSLAGAWPYATAVLAVIFVIGYVLGLFRRRR